ncbi:MAG: MBL fold metallo-hydrolase [Candidatus Eisenbacteria bacterium]|uniref:MBL fold metallo-hydrolase n=1 Tax=Eiseniibacteriota bacterium TaxID=2212470 RepID=A0A956RNB3_UNCEI|nr:MBL fold metallo-hydrolase [Candidatus Eisenbacteria bacterium]
MLPYALPIVAHFIMHFRSGIPRRKSWEALIPLSICALASGSSGNAVLVRTDRTAVLVDAGLSARVIEERLVHQGLAPHALAGIFITHAHADHYRTAGTLHARHGIPLFLDPTTESAIRKRGRRIAWRRVRETRPIPDEVGDLEVRALDTSHAAEGRTVAYRFTHGKSSVAVATDLGTVPETLAAGLRGVDALLLEANYDAATVRRKLHDRRFATSWSYLEWVESDRGHLSNDQCAAALLEILPGPEAQVLLGHVSENHRRADQDNNHWMTAEDTVRLAFARAGLRPPQLHRTFRTGHDPGRASVAITVD